MNSSLSYRSSAASPAGQSPPIYARPGAPGYRADIDGLRAIAVTPVVLFHAGIPLFSGGFVGVDVFFVISGYLITQVILRDSVGQGFSIVKFYERRIRRIIPALFVLMAFCLLVAPFLFIPPDYKSFSKSVVATVLFLSNVSFWREAGYFGAGAQVKPLLHTWSLAVEEQFYLLYPIFIAAILKWKPRLLVPSLVVGFVLSFVASVWGVSHAANSTFYLSPFRAWELLVGCFLALDIPPAISSRLAREIGSVLGIGSIFWAVFALSEDSLFPGANALFPCIGAGLVIYTNARSLTYIGRLLSSRPFVFIGLISYSLYLWHWPILVFAQQWRGPISAPSTTIWLLMLSFAAATLSWRYVEQPFRISGALFAWPRLFQMALAAAIFIGAAGTAGVISNGWPSRFSPAVLKLANYVNYGDSEITRRQFRLGTCFIELSSAAGYDARDCFRPDKHKRNVLLWGDSLMAHYFHGLENVLKPQNVQLLEAAKGACPPIPGTEYLEGRGCVAFNRMIWSLIESSKIDAVVLSGNWLRGVDQSTDEMIVRLEKTVDRLQRRRLPVIVIGPSIEYGDRLPLLLTRYQVSGGEANLSPRNFLRDDAWRLDEKMSRRFAKMPGVTYVSILQTMCPRNRCPLYAAPGVPMEFDTHHLTLDASIVVAKAAIAKPILAILKTPQR